MATPFDSNEITGPKDGPCDDASRYTDGTLRLVLEKIDTKVKQSNLAIWNAGFVKDEEKLRENKAYRRGLLKARSILVETTKEKLTQREARTPTSGPSV